MVQYESSLIWKPRTSPPWPSGMCHTAGNVFLLQRTVFVPSLPRLCTLLCSGQVCRHRVPLSRALEISINASQSVSTSVPASARPLLILNQAPPLFVRTLLDHPILPQVPSSSTSRSSAGQRHLISLSSFNIRRAVDPFERVIIEFSMALDLDLETELGIGQDTTVGKSARTWRMTVPPTPPAKDVTFPKTVLPARGMSPVEENLDADPSTEEAWTAATVAVPSRRPPPLRLDAARPGTGSSVGSGMSASTRPSTSSSQAPNRPLPPRPTVKKTANPAGLSLNISTPPTRALLQPPLRPAMLKPQAPLGMNPPTRPGTAASERSTATRMVGSTKTIVLHIYCIKQKTYQVRARKV